MSVSCQASTLTPVFVIYAAYALAWFYGAILITQGRADAGVVINVFLAVLIGSFSLAEMNPMVQAITKARAAAGKLFATMDRKPPIDSSLDSGDKPGQVFGHITFEVGPGTSD